MTLIERPSVCTFDCPDTCSLTVTVEAERIVKVRGSDALPFTDGVICNKVAQDMTAFVHGPDRLLNPLRRTGPKGAGAFETITWPAALDEIRDRVGQVIERWGPEAVMPLNYAGPHGMLAGDSMSLRFFHKLGASLALSPLAVRGGAHGGVDRHLRRGAGHSAGTRGRRQAQRRLGQQRHRRQPAPGAQGQALAAQRRKAHRHRSQAHQDRRAGRPASGD